MSYELVLRCTGVPVFWCTVITGKIIMVNKFHGVPGSKCTDVPVSRCHGVPVLRCTSVTVSQGHGVPGSWCADVPVSRCIQILCQDRSNIYLVIILVKLIQHKFKILFSKIRYKILL